VVMPGALTLAVMSFLAGGLFDRYGGRTIAITGFILLVLSTVLFHFILDMNNPFIVTTTLFMLSMAGVALINIPIMTAGSTALLDHLIPHGTSVINTARHFGGSIGLTFIISFLSRVEASSTTLYPRNYLTGLNTPS